MLWLMRLMTFIVLLMLPVACAFAEVAPEVKTVRLPEGGYAPQCVIDEWNGIHVLYATGDPRKATLHYVPRPDLTKPIEGGQTIATNAIVAGAVRDPQLAIGQLRCPYFGWMVSPKEFLCTNVTQTNHLNEPANIITSHPGVDGGAAIAFAPDKTFYAVWHAPENPKDDKESNRKIFIARSTTGDYEKFDKIASDNAPRGRGACACCALAAYATNDNLYVLYRCATEQIHRDIHLLTFDKALNCTDDQTLNAMTANKCIMSTASFAPSRDHLYVAYESDTNVYLHRVQDPLTLPIPGKGVNRKHPNLAINNDNTILITWTENTTHHAGGDIAWQLYSPELKPLSEIAHAQGLPALSHPAPFAKPDGSFVILY